MGLAAIIERRVGVKVFREGLRAVFMLHEGLRSVGMAHDGGRGVWPRRGFGYLAVWLVTFS